MQLRVLAALAASCVLGGARPARVAAQARETPPAPPADSARPPAAPTASRSRPGWNDERTRQLVERATERRARQLADTGLVDYSALAHGYVTFLGQLGEGFTEPPKIIKADELALEVYWKAPDLSKQRIVGRRDTLLLLTDIQYHRDHLGIVQNNFPSVIRLGEGDEVRDVPHPLSAAGLAEYDFAAGDSLRIRLPDRTIEVIEVRVRPKDDTKPRVVGAVYLDRDEAQVVRMAFDFTRAAFLDKNLEDISIVLENALVAGRFWLPVRQEVEIRRTGTVLDFPARGIIRGRWEICCYQVNQGLDRALFVGPEIVQVPQSIMTRYHWTGRVLDSLPPDVRAVTDEEVRRVQEEARELVRARALARTRAPTLSGRRVSDFVRVNRVEGLALGGGATYRPGGGVGLAAYGRYGIDDRDGKGELRAGVQRASGAGAWLFARRSYRDAGDVQETSLARNSLAAQEFGSDYTDPYDVRAAGLALDLGRRLGAPWRLEAAYETQGALAVHATPAAGRYEPTLPALALRAVRVALAADRPPALAWFGTELRLAAELRGERFAARDTALRGPAPWLGRVALAADVERPFGRQRLVLRTTAAAVRARPVVPPQDLVYLGGPTSAPGYAYHEFAGRLGASQRVEWRLPVPFVSVPLGRFGRVPQSATLAPFVHAVYVRHPDAARPSREGLYSAAGAGLLTLFDALRFDVARGLRDGRWTFSVDVAREFWSVL